VRHPCGFWILDIEQQEETADESLRPYADGPAFTLRRRLLPHEAMLPAAPLARWLGWLMAYVRVRLARALCTPMDEVGRLLCRHPARVQVTGNRLDVVLRLADLPIEVRRAGIDRDPGWVPAAGRTIAFRFD
jgi:hypothetical protein